MRTLLFISFMGMLTLYSTEAKLVFPKMQMIEFAEYPITSGTRKELCDKYNILFMEALHQSLECTEDGVIDESKQEYCRALTTRLREYSILRSMYCYEENL